MRRGRFSARFLLTPTNITFIGQVYDFTADVNVATDAFLFINLLCYMAMCNTQQSTRILLARFRNNIYPNHLHKYTATHLNTRSLLHKLMGFMPGTRLL